MKYLLKWQETQKEITKVEPVNGRPQKPILTDKIVQKEYTAVDITKRDFYLDILSKRNITPTVEQIDEVKPLTDIEVIGLAVAELYEMIGEL